MKKGTWRGIMRKTTQVRTFRLEYCPMFLIVPYKTKTRQRKDLPHRSLPLSGSAIHPVRHPYAEGELPSTYIYIFDSSPEGIKYAQEVSLTHSVPYGPVKDMSNNGMVLSFLTMYAYTYDRTQVFFNCILAIGLWQENFRERVTPKMM